MEGDILKIHTYPSGILKKKAKPVENFNDELRLLIKNMLYTMYKAPGIGLAAPQVGVSKRIFVIDKDYEKTKVSSADGTEKVIYSNFNPLVFINPVLEVYGEDSTREEGCLSVPGIYEQVKRKKMVKVNFLDMYGNEKEIKDDSLLSICIQHENDHLDGVVFLERLSLIKRKLLTKKFLKHKKSND